MDLGNKHLLFILLLLILALLLNLIFDYSLEVIVRQSFTVHLFNDIVYGVCQVLSMTENLLSITFHIWFLLQLSAKFLSRILELLCNFLS